MRNAGNRHTAFIYLARVRSGGAFPDAFLWFGVCANGSIGVAGVAAPFIIRFCIGYGDLFDRIKRRERYISAPCVARKKRALLSIQERCMEETLLEAKRLKISLTCTPSWITRERRGR